MKADRTYFRIDDKPYKIILFCFILTFFGMFIAWSTVMVWIKTDAHRFANQAMIRYNENETESLLMLIFDENTSVLEKNMAIWTLGTLKNEEALNDLEKLDSLIIEDENFGISGYELNKAILKIKGDFRGNWRVTQNN